MADATRNFAANGLDLTADERLEILNNIAKNGGLKSCDRCGSMSMAAGERVMSIGGTLNVIPIVCLKCGAVYLHATSAIGTAGK